MPSYMQYKRQIAVLDEDNIQWITVKGNHIPIKEGQSKEDAVKSFFESKGGESGSNRLDELNKKHDKQKGYLVQRPIEELKSKKGWAEATKLPEMYEHTTNKKGEITNAVYGTGNGFVEYSEKKSVESGKNSGKVYKNTMSKVRNFKANEEGTFDYETGKPKSYPKGYSVSFHQNEPDENGNYKSDYGRYSDADYDKNVKDMVEKTGGELNIGYFAGTPEVSVWVDDVFKAVKFAIDNNQQSIWDWEKGDILENPYYDPKKNPMKK